MLGGIEAQGLFGQLDAVVAGHFSAPEQVAIAADTLGRVRVASPAARLVVDPVMGDEGRGLYVRPAVAVALAMMLVPLADIVTPNAWELSRLTSRAVDDAQGAVAASRALGKAVMVSSIHAGADIGAVYADLDGAWLASHAEATSAPKGTGDLLTALFTAALLGGFGGPDALGLAVGGVADAVDEAAGLDELPLSSLPTSLGASPFVSLAPVDG
jgi:pyridoxine kinase